MEFKISPENTAVVVIDLQKGITAFPSAPHNPQDVIHNAVKVIEKARKTNMPVFLVHVTPSSDFRDALRPDADNVMAFSNLPADWAEYVTELNVQPTDIQITKRHWGAFYGTELDLQLRRRGIKTILLCGISTNIGVESTARVAYELGYNQVFIEDAMAARSEEEHTFPLKTIFPRMGKVRSTKEVLEAITEA
ncbi:MAG: hydrolase [Bacteroidales bacterium]|nr:hydrolase [Bacteroidales bacterium]